MNIGDIVQVTNKAGKWCVMGFEPSPGGSPYVRLSRPGNPHPEAFVTHVAAVTLVESQTFNPGDTVRVGDGRVGTVIQDGVTHVTVETAYSIAVPGSRGIRSTGRGPKSRGQLTRDNRIKG